MKKVIKVLAVILAVLVLLILGFRWFTRPAHRVPEVSAGTLVRMPDFPCRNVSPRVVSVWLPEGYSEQERYPVLYMHDGQMLFDAEATWNHQEWGVDETLTALISEGKVPPCIVVAMNNTADRLDEYFPQKVVGYLDRGIRSKSTMIPTGDAYVRFMVNVLKPYIDQHYSTLPDKDHTFIAGSSMGGLISLYAVYEYPEVFGGAACLSTHVSMEKLPMGKENDAWAEAFLAYLADSIPSSEDHVIYMDHGTKGFDAGYGPWQERIDVLFREKGWDEAHYRSRVIEGHDHNETCWSERLPGILCYLLNGQNPK